MTEISNIEVPEHETETVVSPLLNGDPIAAATGGRKVLSITIEFEVGAKKTHNTRLKEAYQAAVRAADAAVRAILLDDSIKGLMSRMVYDYRHLEGAMVPWNVVTEEEGEAGALA